LAPLLRFAKERVPADARASTPLLLYGTAGMRLLSGADQGRVYASALEACEASGFDVLQTSFVTLSGEDEGYYGLLALMWLHTTATAPGDTPAAPAGILDLGGGSTQIAFPLVAGVLDLAAGAELGDSPPQQPDATRAATDREVREVRVGEVDVTVFSRSHLGFGNRVAMRHVEEILLDRQPAGSSVVEHPCFHSGYNYTAKRSSHVFVGTAQNEECGRLVGCLFDCRSATCLGSVARDSDPTPCSRTVPFVRGPAPPKGQRFFGLSAMFYVTNYLFFKRKLGQMPTPSISELRIATASVCALPWTAIRASARDPFTPEHKLPQRCFDAQYMLALLVRGFGFAEDSRQITFAEKVGIGQPEWPYGAIIHFLANDHSPSRRWVRAVVSLTVCALALVLALLAFAYARRRRRGLYYPTGGTPRDTPCGFVRELVDEAAHGRRMRSFHKTSGTNSDASDGDLDETEKIHAASSTTMEARSTQSQNVKTGCRAV